MLYAFWNCCHADSWDIYSIYSEQQPATSAECHTHHTRNGTGWHRTLESFMHTTFLPLQIASPMNSSLTHPGHGLISTDSCCWKSFPWPFFVKKKPLNSDLVVFYRSFIITGKQPCWSQTFKIKKDNSFVPCSLSVEGRFRAFSGKLLQPAAWK